MKALSHLFYKVTLASMIVTAPAMSIGINTDANYGSAAGKETRISWNSSTVIKRFVHYNNLVFSTAPDKPLSLERSVASSASSASSARSVVKKALEVSPESLVLATTVATNSSATAEERAAAYRAELVMVINQAGILYGEMNLARTGLSEQAFEYAWRGYHNLVKKGVIRKKNVLSICDFSQSSHKRRLYVIDIRHKKLLYRTYVAHGQNSGSEFASSFSNRPDSWKSSLGFYLTARTYYGHNGLSLKIEGLDSGFNDLAGKRNIVLHGCSYVGVRYKTHYGNEGTSLGCPAVPNSMSPRIIRAVKNGSCFFIYHPTQQYLNGSAVLNSSI
jgi:hypothetical protein